MIIYNYKVLYLLSFLCLVIFSQVKGFEIKLDSFDTSYDINYLSNISSGFHEKNVLEEVKLIREEIAWENGRLKKWYKLDVVKSVKWFLLVYENHKIIFELIAFLASMDNQLVFSQEIGWWIPFVSAAITPHVAETISTMGDLLGYILETGTSSRESIARMCACCQSIDVLKYSIYHHQIAEQVIALREGNF